MIYADTSLLLPIYVPEAQSELADQILQSASSIVVSDLGVAELYVGLARKVKLGELTLEQAKAARAAFESHLNEGLLERVALRPAHSDAAGDLASKSPAMLRTLDALHLAVAAELDASLATFDRRLAEAGRALNFEVLP